MTTEDTGINLAIAAAGSQKLLAAKLGCTQQTVSAWKAQGHVPLVRVVEVEQHTGIPRTKLINPRYVNVVAQPTF